MQFVVFFLVVLAARVAEGFSFTGNVETDFSADLRGLATVDDFSGPDVMLPESFDADVISGFDVKDVRFYYEADIDALHIGINCFGVCGDADGDGMAGDSSDVLVSLGGEDHPRMGGTESFVLALDLGLGSDGGLDGNFDLAVGYPGRQNAGSELYAACDDSRSLDASCFGVYFVDTFSEAEQLPNRLVYTESGNVLPHAATDQNARPTLARPDIEWTIHQFNALRRKIGAPEIDGVGVWRLNFLLVAGSQDDDGIPDDIVPDGSAFRQVQFTCSRFDPCDVCGGDGSTCADCAGVPNGDAVVDNCGVCNGDGLSCAEDCNGVPAGTSVEDECGVCDGDGTSCGARPPRDPCSVDFGRCQFNAGDLWRGVYRTNMFDPQLSGEPFALHVATEDYAMEVNARGSLWHRWVVTDNFVAVQDLAQYVIPGSPGDLACEDTSVAKYAVTFTGDCRRVTLTSLHDSCSRRRQLLTDVELILSTPPAPADDAPCLPHHDGGRWTATYANVVDSHSGMPMEAQFTFSAEGHAAVETNGMRQHFFRFHVEADGETVRITDHGSQDASEDSACLSPRSKEPIVGTYRLMSNDACDALRLTVVQDGCTARQERLSGLELSRADAAADAAAAEDNTRKRCARRAQCVRMCDANRVDSADNEARFQSCLQSCTSFDVLNRNL